MSSWESRLFPGSAAKLRQETHFLHTAPSRTGPDTSVGSVLLKAR